MQNNIDIIKRKIMEQQTKINEFEETKQMLEEMLIKEAADEKGLCLGDTIKVKKVGTMNAEYTGVIGGFEMLNDTDIKVTVFKFRSDGKTPSKQIHPNGSALIEEVTKA